MKVDIPSPGRIFEEPDRGLVVIILGLIFGIYAKLTGDIRPFSIFVFVIVGGFLFKIVNYLLGKMSS